MTTKLHTFINNIYRAEVHRVVLIFQSLKPSALVNGITKNVNSQVMEGKKEEVKMCILIHYDKMLV